MEAIFHLAWENIYPSPSSDNPASELLQLVQELAPAQSPKISDNANNWYGYAMSCTLALCLLGPIANAQDVVPTATHIATPGVSYVFLVRRARSVFRRNSRHNAAQPVRKTRQPLSRLSVAAPPCTRSLPMVHIAVQALFHLLAQLYLVAQAVIFAAILTLILSRQRGATATRKIMLANVSRSSQKSNLTQYSNRRNF